MHDVLKLTWAFRLHVFQDDEEEDEDDDYLGEESNGSEDDELYGYGHQRSGAHRGAGGGAWGAGGGSARHLKRSRIGNSSGRRLGPIATGYPQTGGGYNSGGMVAAGGWDPHLEEPTGAPMYEEPPLEFFEYTGPLPETLIRAEAEAVEAAAAAKLRVRLAEERAAAAKKLLPAAPLGRIVVEFLMDCEGDDVGSLMLSPTSQAAHQHQQQQAASLSTLSSSQLWIKSAYGDMDLEPL